MARVIRRTLKINHPTVAIGVDPSLTGTGVALIHDGAIRWFRCWTEVKSYAMKWPGLLRWYKPQGKTMGDQVARINAIATWVMGLISEETNACDVYVAIEGYAYVKHSRALSDLHELSGYLKQLLFERRIPFRVYDPLSVKMAATGNGHADKGSMALACFKRLGVDVSRYFGAGENIADAALIAWLLEHELSAKTGYKTLDDMQPSVRKVLLRETKAVPEPLISRPFVHQDVIRLPPSCYD